jgi:hypothetical protein
MVAMRKSWPAPGDVAAWVLAGTGAQHAVEPQEDEEDASGDSGFSIFMA